MPEGSSLLFGFSFWSQDTKVSLQHGCLPTFREKTTLPLLLPANLIWSSLHLNSSGTCVSPFLTSPSQVVALVQTLVVSLHSAHPRPFSSSITTLLCVWALTLRPASSGPVLTAQPSFSEAPEPAPQLHTSGPLHLLLNQNSNCDFSFLAQGEQWPLGCPQQGVSSFPKHFLCSFMACTALRPVGPLFGFL